MATPEERLLELSRDVYSDHREREGRLQQLSTGLLAYNGAFAAFLGAGLWEISHSPIPAPAAGVWLLAVAILLGLAASGLHLFVATRIPLSWPEPTAVLQAFDDNPSAGAAITIARVYADATALNQEVLDRKYQLVAVANLISATSLLAALTTLIITVAA
jgi:hypothetical protein